MEVVYTGWTKLHDEICRGQCSCKRSRETEATWSSHSRRCLLQQMRESTRMEICMIPKLLCPKFAKFYQWAKLFDMIRLFNPFLRLKYLKMIQSQEKTWLCCKCEINMLQTHAFISHKVVNHTFSFILLSQGEAAGKEWKSNRRSSGT